MPRLAVVMTLSVESVAFAQGHEATRVGDLDLAELGASTEFSIQVQGDVSIRLLNKVVENAATEYSVKAEVIEPDIPPFELGLFKTKAPAAKSREERLQSYQAQTAAGGPCDIPFKKVLDATDEKAVKLALGELSKLSQCAETYWEAIDRTQSSFSAATGMSLGDSLKVTVSRGKADSMKTWVVLFRGKVPGVWVASYSFAFLYSLDEDFFARQTGPNTYEVTKKNGRERLTFAPAILFSWHASSVKRSFLDGVSGGLGFDLSDPVVFLGYQGTMHRNLTLTGGIAVAKVNRLKGRYKEKDPLSENLSEDQLHDRLYRATLFASVGFRFGSSPF